MDYRTKIKSPKALKPLLRQLQKEGKKVVFTNGCFDILHIGHVRYLSKAKACGDILVVALNSDRSVRRVKGKNRPIVSENDRAEVIASLQFTDFVTFFKEDTPYNVISGLQPDLLVKGGDWKKDQIIGSDIVLKRGGKVKTIHYVKGKSTTHIISKWGKRKGLLDL